MESNRFLKGTIILTMAGIITKALGAIYRIPLYNILGREGMGLFQAAYPIYSMMLSISTAGVPVAVSKIVAERLASGNYLGARQVFRVALMLMFASGLIVTGVLLLGSRYYTDNILQAPGVFLPLVAIAPSVLLFALKSALRGYFQGHQTMIPTALSQVVEQLVRVSTIFILASLLVRHSLELGAAGAAFGTVTGAVISLLLLVAMYYRGQGSARDALPGVNNVEKPTGTVIKEILALALPITIGSIVLPLVNMVDSTLVIPRLQAGGFDETAALQMFGDFTGAAMPLVGLPNIFTVAIATSLVPAIANARARGQRVLIGKLANLASRLGLMIGLPAAAGLYLLAEPISIMLYQNLEVARSLSVASFAVIFIALTQTTAPVLQALGKTYLPVIHMFIGLLFKVVLNYFLTAVPGINILGPAFGTVIGFAIASSLNLVAISRNLGWVFTIRQSFVKPVFNSLLMGLVVFQVARLSQATVVQLQLGWRIEAAVVAMLAIGAGLLTYGAATLITGTITRTELELIPKVGPKFARTLMRLRLLRR